MVQERFHAAIGLALRYYNLRASPISRKVGLTIPIQPNWFILFQLLRASAASSAERISSPTSPLSI